MLYTDGIIEGRIGVGSERLGEAGLHRLVAERIGRRRAAWREDPDVLLDELVAGAEERRRSLGGRCGDDPDRSAAGLHDRP